MRFVRNGPDIPERLLQAHEDGHVVLFCGAGISYPAGLPSFARLVDQLYGNLNIAPDAEQQAAIKTKRFDTAISLLENGVVGGREVVRTELARILAPNLDTIGVNATHKALLTLSQTREGRTRLVTTNFDRLFEKAIDETNLEVERFRAPMLPVPKSRWDGLVYLHGLLSAEPSAQELDRLVVSSGDFGLAYLIERWAARFVGELFQNYTVCFVGYSIDDPVLRYMTDALAADRLLGEAPLEMFAFGSCSKSKEKEQTNKWKARNVTPILYREFRHHQYLHRTLREWAKIYRDGVFGKEQIVTRYASSIPLASASQDDFVGRVLWALSDPSGLPAKRFADHDPVPSLDWLEPLSEKRYRHIDLSRFGVTPHADGNDKLTYGLILRPCPHTRAPWMSLVDEGGTGREWDDVMSNLAHWLLRHLDDPKLLLWLTKRGGRLHPELIRRIEWRLEELGQLETDGNTDELDRIRDSAPRAIPRPFMRTLWRLLLVGRMKSLLSTADIFQWRERFERDGLTTALRFELRDLLTPRVALRPPFRWDGDGKIPDEPERIHVECEVVLSSDRPHSDLRDLRSSPCWSEALPDLLDDFGALLRDAMDLMRELGEADDWRDRSYVHRPSVQEHSQNRNFRDWTALIELARDAWLATAAVAREQARFIAEAWQRVKYPVFRRLAFFSAMHDDVIPLRQGLDWLLADDHWWLWSPQCRREVMRLLTTMSPKLDDDLLADLEHAVLVGPPRAMYENDLEDERWIRIVEREVWLRLAKMNEAGTALGEDAKAKFDNLTVRHPDWRLQEENREEFSFWIGDGSELRRHVAMPHRRRDLVHWIREHPETPQWPNEDDWDRRCLADFPTTACALYALARDDNWPIDRWHEALEAWFDEKLIKQSWRYMAPVLAIAPDDVLRQLVHGVGFWLESLSNTFDGHEALFLDLCRRILALDDGEDANQDTNDLFSRAISHPTGQVTEALLNWWYRSSPEDKQALPNELRVIFTDLCDVRIGKFRHSRILLVTHAVSLFNVDREWTERHLLPLFDWSCEAEACAAWEGLLWSSRLYYPLMECIKRPFLDTAQHYEKLGPHREHYPALLTSAALDRGDTFTMKELRTAIKALPPKGLQIAANALSRALDSSGEQRAEYWRNRALPYLRSIWPRSLDLRTPAVSESLAKVCIAARDAFPEALDELRHWLLPPQHPGRLMYRLKESKLCEKFPEYALDFLELIVDYKSAWGVRECLEQIQVVDAELIDDQRFQRLRERLRQFGQELEQ